MARHSAGSLVAVDSYFEAPERVAALILVAPAIFAPRVASNTIEENPRKGNNQSEKDKSASVNLLKPFIKLCEVFSLFTKYIIDGIIRLAKRMADMLNSLYKKSLSAILRSAVGVMLVNYHLFRWFLVIHDVLVIPRPFEFILAC